MNTKVIMLWIVAVFGSILEINAAKNPEICSLPLESGMCRAGDKQWGYNTETKKCVIFPWGGCDDGNANRFQTEELCKKTCEDDEETEINDKFEVIPGTCNCQCPKCDFIPEINLRKNHWQQSGSENSNNFRIHFPLF